MARDYKRRTSRRRGQARKPPQGLTFLAAGFGLGVIASIVLYRMFAPLPPVGPDTPVPTAQREPQSAVEAEAEQAATTLPPPSGRRARKQLEFYEVLPNYEVIVPESDERVAVAKPLEKIDTFAGPPRKCPSRAKARLIKNGPPPVNCRQTPKIRNPNTSCANTCMGMPNRLSAPNT